MCSVDIYEQSSISPVTPLPVDVSDKVTKCLKTCQNPPRGREGKRIGTLASEDVVRGKVGIMLTG